MKKYEILIQAETIYTVEANNSDEALDKALEYWEQYEPYYEINEIDESEE